MGKYEYVLFDLDGTVLDTFEGVTRSFAYALEHYGIHVEDMNELLPILGPPLLDAFMDMYGFDREKATEAVAKYRERYVNTFVEESKLFPGIKDTIIKLYEDGYKLCVATAKPEFFAFTLLEHYDLKKYFTFIAGATMDEARNTKNKVLDYIIKTADINTEKAVMIGDRNHDLLGAAKFGIDGIGVLYGFAPDGELEECPHVYLAKNAEELYNYIRTR